jgi:hypothetical protein
MRSRWSVGFAIPFGWLASCSNANSGFQSVISSSGGGDDGGGGGSESGIVFTSGFDGGLSLGDSTVSDGSGGGPCKGGHYSGTFAGTYTSHLTGIGIPIPVTGNVDMSLDQVGSDQMTCTLVGEATKCSDLFSLQNGTITGIADEGMIGDAGFGGFPYFCTMTGTLACAEKKLVGGWIQCTYCVGPLADGGMACSLLNGVAGTTGVGGHFAGPLTANYDYSTLSFVMGTWNGAESLAGNDGGSPGPDGGPISEYLSDSGTYLGLNDFGGSGTWNATYR